jgi:hypothetical protein
MITPQRKTRKIKIENPTTIADRNRGNRNHASNEFGQPLTTTQIMKRIKAEATSIMKKSRMISPRYPFLFPVISPFIFFEF